MDAEIQEKSDRAFTRRLEETGARDPRDVYRGMLRDLRAEDEAAYEEMVRRYRVEVLEAIAAGDADPLVVWLRFGTDLAERLHGGRTVVVDGTGRALPLEGAPSWEALILHLPGTRQARAVPLGIPPEPTAQQRATLDLLVNGRVRLPGERTGSAAGS